MMAARSRNVTCTSSRVLETGFGQAGWRQYIGNEDKFCRPFSKEFYIVFVGHIGFGLLSKYSLQEVGLHACLKNILML